MIQPPMPLWLAAVKPMFPWQPCKEVQPVADRGVCEPQPGSAKHQTDKAAFAEEQSERPSKRQRTESGASVPQGSREVPVAEAQAMPLRPSSRQQVQELHRALLDIQGDSPAAAWSQLSDKLDEAVAAGQLCGVDLDLPALLPVAQRLTKAPSRPLLNAILDTGKLHPQAVVDSLLAPMLTSSMLARPQCEILSCSIKELSQEMQAALLLAALTSGVLQNNASSLHALGCLEHLVRRRPKLDQGTIDVFVAALESAASNPALTTSPKFVMLVQMFVTSYQAQLSSSATRLDQVVMANSSFLAKAARAKIASLLQ